ncbi:MAG: hypothetical protein HYZ54_02120 [Ignavibacteriae bacterium]|nr:hypothetical protein [Ignavibacteriota bacterium]
MNKNPFKFILLLFAKFVLTLVLSAVVIALFPYSLSNVYDFPLNNPFSGNILYNPYQSVDSNTRLIKANFHAHSRAYSGATDGHSSEQELFSAYKSMKYDVVGLSNYQTINQTFNLDSGYIPLYEHGYNVWKRHHVCIGANEVTWWDYILFQSIHQKQDMIFHLKPTMDVLAIAHPKFRNSFEPDDFTKLTGYDCIEVLNHYRTSDEAWDSALSTGHPVWIVADDDSHNVSADGETGVCWTMIAAQTVQRSEITKALKEGRGYGVQGKHGINPNKLKSLETDGLRCTVRCDSIADSIQFIGQKGIIKLTSYLTNNISYSFDRNDTYIRVKIFNNGSILWLNPVFRTSKGILPYVHAEINTINTWLWRIVWFGICLCLAAIAIRKKRKSK